MQDTWSKEERGIKLKGNQRASIECTHGPHHRDHACALKKEVITVVIETSAAHLDRQIAIQGARSMVFYNASQTAHPHTPSKIQRLRYNQNGPRWTV